MFMRCPERSRRNCFENKGNADSGIYGQTLLKQVAFGKGMIDS